MCNRVTEEMEDLNGRKDAFHDWALPLFYLRRRVGKSPDGHGHLGDKRQQVTEMASKVKFWKAPLCTTKIKSTGRVSVSYTVSDELH